MSNYHKQRQTNVDHFNKLKAKTYESDSIRQILKASCKSILTYDSPNQPPTSSDGFIGDYKQPEFGLGESFLPELNDPVISDLFKSGKPLRILDFACGTGLLDYYLAPYLPNDSEIVGIDISKYQLEVFKDKFPGIKKKNPNLKITLAELDIIDDEYNQKYSLKYPESLKPGTFDLIFTTLTYHHFQSVDDITKALKSYLKPHGVFIILDLFDGKSEATPNDPDPNHAVAHHGGFSPEVLQSFLSGHGFKYVKTGISFSFQQWSNEQSIRGHVPSERFDHVFNYSPVRKINGFPEYLIDREMTIAVCKL